MDLLDRIQRGEARVAVVGLGYVGLPLCVEFARAGLRVTGIDVDPGRTRQVMAGESYIPDVPADVLRELVEAGTLDATSDLDALAQVDAISICVPTPLGKSKDPDISYIVSAAEGIRPRLRRGQLVTLESTTYPGTTVEVLRPKLEESGLVAGEDFHLAFSPERVDPGNPTYTTRNTPKIIGGLTPRCGEVAKALYERAVDTVVLVSTTQAAEMVKLLENTFRAVNIGLVNEIAIMSHRLGIDVWEVIEAAATKPFGFMPFYPGPGLGGHCIPVDPHYLSWKLKLLNYHARFIELAGEVNSSMPAYVVSRVGDELNRRRRCLNGARILVLGVAYKRDVSDIRESPSLDIIKLLHDAGAEVAYHDPQVPVLQLEIGANRSVSLDEQRLRESDAVIVVTDHSGIDWARVVEHAPFVFDARNAIPGEADHVVRL